MSERALASHPPLPRRPSQPAYLVVICLLGSVALGLAWRVWTRMGSSDSFEAVAFWFALGVLAVLKLGILLHERRVTGEWHLGHWLDWPLVLGLGLGLAGRWVSTGLEFVAFGYAVAAVYVGLYRHSRGRERALVVAGTMVGFALALFLQAAFALLWLHAELPSPSGRQKTSPAVWWKPRDLAEEMASAEQEALSHLRVDESWDAAAGVDLRALLEPFVHWEANEMEASTTLLAVERLLSLPEVEDAYDRLVEPLDDEASGDKELTELALLRYWVGRYDELVQVQARAAALPRKRLVEGTLLLALLLAIAFLMSDQARMVRSLRRQLFQFTRGRLARHRRRFQRELGIYYGVTHQLNTQVGKITMLWEKLHRRSRQSGDPGEHREADGIAHAARTIRDTLDLLDEVAQAEARGIGEGLFNELTEVDLTPMLRRVATAVEEHLRYEMRLLRGAAAEARKERGLAITIVLPDEPESVVLERVRPRVVEILLQEILVNAAKYEAAAVEAPGAPRVEITLSEDAADVVVVGLTNHYGQRICAGGSCVACGEEVTERYADRRDRAERCGECASREIEARLNRPLDGGQRGGIGLPMLTHYIEAFHAGDLSYEVTPEPPVFRVRTELRLRRHWR